MLAFCVIIFFFVSSAFSKSIFAMGILNATIPYRFRANLALLSSTLVQPSSPLNFLASSSFVVCITMSPICRVCAARSLIVGVNPVYNFFRGLLFYHLRRGNIVELDYYFVVFIVEGRTQLRVGCHCRLNIWFEVGYCCCLLFFQNSKLVVYPVLLLRLLFCELFYTFKLLPHLSLRCSATRRFRILDADTYDLLYLLNRYLVACFDLFLDGF